MHDFLAGMENRRVIKTIYGYNDRRQQQGVLIISSVLYITII